MTLGEMIKAYADENSMAEFVHDSGISRAYAYLLIANKNNSGTSIVPTIDTIKKVSKGLHMDFDEVFNALDYDFVIRVNKQKKKSTKEERPEIKRLISLARKCSSEDVKLALAFLERLSKK